MVIYEDEMLSIWRFSKVSCAYWTGECLDVHCQASLKELAYVQANNHAYMSIIGIKAKPPSARHRKIMTDAIKGAATPTPTAVYVLADGFAGAVYRSVITAMHTITKTHANLKVCASAADAAAFCATSVGDNAAKLYRQVEEARALVDVRATQ